MAAPTTFWAPVHRALQRFANSAAAGLPLNAAPSLDFLASGLQDHRWPYNRRGASPNMPGILGWHGAGAVMVCNYVPSTYSNTNIAAAQTLANGTAMTLVGASGAGITVLTTAAPATFFPSYNVVSSGVCIDGLPSLHAFGTNGDFNTSFYNRGTYVGRGVSITAAAGATGGGILLTGTDAYGYTQTQTITAVAGTTVNSTKTFKAITSITPQFTDAGHNYSVGTADIYGFGILASYWGDVDVTWNNASITASTGFTAADTTNPATATTGDVRGTYAVQSASDGTKRLQICVIPTIGSLASNPTTGLFGQTPA